MRPAASWPGIRVCSSVPSGPAASSAVPPWRVMLAAISERMSAQMPSERGAANACSCTADSPRTAVTPTTVWASWSTSSRSSMPGTPASHSDPRSSRPSASSTSERSNGPPARLGAAATGTAVARRSSAPSVASARVGSSARGRGVRGLRRRLGRVLVGTAEDAHGSAQSFGRSCCAWSAGRSWVPNPPLAPCPVSPRWLPGSESTSRKLTRLTSWTTSWAIRSPRRTVNVSAGSRLTRLTWISPRKPASTVPGGVQRGHAVARGQPGAGVHERGVPAREGDRHAGRHQGPGSGRQGDVGRGT